MSASPTDGPTDGPELDAGAAADRLTGDARTQEALDAAGPAGSGGSGVDAAEPDPSAAGAAALPGYSAGAGEGDAAVGPPSQDPGPTP